MGYELGWNHPLILTFDPNFQQDIQVAILRSFSLQKRPSHFWLFAHVVGKKTVPQPKNCISERVGLDARIGPDSFQCCGVFHAVYSTG